MANENYDALQAEVSKRLRDIFNLMDEHRVAQGREPAFNGPHFMETPDRVAKMWVKEKMGGLFTNPPPIKEFPNPRYDAENTFTNLQKLGPFSIRSMCSHHLVPIVGQCWVITSSNDENVLGISKFGRLIDWACNRPTVQEDLAYLILEEVTKFNVYSFVGVVIKAQHLCMSWRGVESENSWFTTSAFSGEDDYDIMQFTKVYETILGDN